MKIVLLVLIATVTPHSHSASQQHRDPDSSSSSLLVSPRRCPAPAAPANGRARLKPGGRGVTFRCRRRFALVGEFHGAVCHRGRWVPDLRQEGAPRYKAL